jgi:hypothetical protein
MAQFEMVVNALADGRSIRLPKWDSTTRVYFKDGVLVCQHGEAQPYPYHLSWLEIAANNWQVIEGAKAAYSMQAVPTSIHDSQ